MLTLKNVFNSQSLSHNTWFLVIFANNCLGYNCFRQSPKVIFLNFNIPKV